MDLIRYLNTVSNNEGMSNYTIIEILKKFCAEIDQNMISSIHVNNVTPSTAKFQIVLKNGTIYQSEAISLPQGEKGNTGNGIESIIKTDTSGLVDTYTITFTNGTTSTFTVTNGADGTDGNGIVSISKTGTSGLIDTYTITFTNGTSSTFNVTNGADGTDGQDGNGIVSISKTGTSGLIDTYTITFTNGTTSTFTVTNGANGTNGTNGQDGNGIVSVTKTGTSGLVDTYTITFTNGTTTTFEITNGHDGAPGPTEISIIETTATYNLTINGTTYKVPSLTNAQAGQIITDVLAGKKVFIHWVPTTPTTYYKEFWLDVCILNKTENDSMYHIWATFENDVYGASFFRISYLISTSSIYAYNLHSFVYQNDSVSFSSGNFVSGLSIGGVTISDFIVEQGTDYIKLVSGIQICWGIQTATGGTKWETINLPKAFLNTNYTIILTTASSYTAGSGSSHAYVGDVGGTINKDTISTTSFQYYTQTSGYTKHWYAIGKWK